MNGQPRLQIFRQGEGIIGAIGVHRRAIRVHNQTFWRVWRVRLGLAEVAVEGKLAFIPRIFSSKKSRRLHVRIRNSLLACWRDC